jgi:prefoldin alpha subunit
MDKQDQFVTSAYSVYATEVRKAINTQESQLRQLEAAHAKLQQTLDSLEQLPTKLKHQVMVPMGRHAFFPGHLTRTNEIMVHLGDAYYAEVTAGHAKGIVQRKQAAVADGITKAQQQLKALHARLTVSGDSLGSWTDNPDAREIRSSLAESDTLLASARKAKQAAAAAAAAAAAGQLQQQQAQRVSTTAGYSYTRPQGYNTAQRTAEQSAEDAALQAKLDQLLLLEQQQELQDVLQEHPMEQQQQHEWVDSIAEGDEQDEFAGTSTTDAAASHTALHHLQLQEAQSDSDDDEVPPQQQQQQQQKSASQPRQQSQQQAVQQPEPLQQQQHHQHVEVPPQQQQQRAPKSMLKKGFLGSRPAASSSKGSQGSTLPGLGAAAKPATAAQPKPAAFTGTVVEHPTPAAAAVAEGPPVVSNIVERLVQVTDSRAAPGTSSSSSSSSKPMSKFKLRRLGLEPDAE